MNFDEFYNAISSFWNSIAPIFYSHVLAILAIKWVLNFRFQIAGRFETFLNTEKYKKWKVTLDEFELRSKLPYLAIVGIIIYFSLFNNIILTTLNDLSITSISYSQTDLWTENKPLDDLVMIGSYGKNSKIRIWEIETLKNNLSEGYKAKYPEYYRSNVNWLIDKSTKWIRYYECAVAFLIFVLIFTIVVMRKKYNRSFKVLFKIFVLLILTILWISYTRYQYELYVEKSLKAEMRFVITGLSFDEEAKKIRLSEEEINLFKYNLFSDLKGTRQYNSFWLLRVLEKVGINQREFPTITDEEFNNRFGYLNQYAPKTENLNSDAPN